MIVNHKLKTWAITDWLTECLTVCTGRYIDVCNGWLVKCKGSFFFSNIYDHSSHYIVILCNVAFHLIWARTRIILLWHFIESDKICDMRRPFTFIRQRDDQFTCVRASVYIFTDVSDGKRMQWEINLLIRKKLYTQNAAEESKMCTQYIYMCFLLMHTYGCSSLKTTTQYNESHTRILNNITTEKRMSDSFFLFRLHSLSFLLRCFLCCCCRCCFLSSLVFTCVCVCVLRECEWISVCSCHQRMYWDLLESGFGKSCSLAKPNIYSARHRLLLYPIALITFNLIFSCFFSHWKVNSLTSM